MELKKVIAKNLVALRTQAHLTQLQLAEMLNYSDKAVSKWERGEAIPDITVFMRLSEIYGVSLDDMVRGEAVEPLVQPKKKINGMRIFIVAMSSVLVWFVSTWLFIMFFFIPATSEYAYLAFVPAPFIMSIVLIVFSGIWGNWITHTISTSMAVWFGIFIVHMFVIAFSDFRQIYLLYIAGGVFQILVFLWFGYRKFVNYFKNEVFKKHKKKSDGEEK